MAEFGVQATQMPDVQSTVGRDIVSPVQEQAVTTNIVPALGNVADIFMKKYAADQKADFEAYKQSVLTNYAQAQQTINDGIQSGEIAPDRAATQSRALFSKTLANYTIFADDIHKINNSMRTGSELGVAEDAVKAAQRTQEAREASARSNGVTLYPWMDKDTKEAALQTNEQSIRLEREWKMQTERNVERRAQTEEERKVQDRDQKETALRMVTEIAGSNLNSTSMFIQNLQQQVSQGKIPFEDASVMMGQHFAQIEGAIQSAAGLNPELGGVYRSLFADMKTLGQKAIDPKTSSETSKAMFDELMYKSKLAAVTSDPKMKAVVVANSLLGGNAVTALGAITPITNYIAKAGSIDSSKGEGYVPQIVGNPDVEKNVLKFLQPAIKKLNQNGYPDNEKAQKEAVSTVNNILKQVGDLQNDPTVRQDPSKFKDLATFFDSPDYGTFVSKGLLNPDAARAAKQVWQSTYEPAVRQSVQTRLSDWADKAVAVLPGNATKKFDLTDMIDVKYDGSGISFVAKTPDDRYWLPGQQHNQKLAIEDLNAAKAGINQSIHIGAHMEGTTDYNAYWEANKHLYIPQLYPAAVGTIVNGYKYKGGVYKDPSNWVKVQ